MWRNDKKNLADEQKGHWWGITRGEVLGGLVCKSLIINFLYPIFMIRFHWHIGGNYKPYFRWRVCEIRLLKYICFPIPFLKYHSI